MRKTALGILLLLVTATAVRSGDGEVRLLTDETIPLYLARGRELARNQQWATMIDVLQRIVIGDPEVFTDLKPEVLHAAVFSDDGQIFYPARELCLKEMAAMPPEGLRTYRSIHDPAARELFRQAEAEGNLDARVAKYARVYDDYLVSSVGDDALEKAGELNLELGRYYEALALFRRLVDVYPKDTDRDLAMVLAKAAYCAARIGDREHRDVLLERLGSEYPRRRIRIEGKLVATGAMHDHAAMRVRGALRGAQSADWPMPGGNPARSRVAQDLPEDLPRKPFWSFKLSERDRRLVADSGHWQVVMHDREAAKPPTSEPHSEFAQPFPTVRPIVYDGLVLYKDCLELLGRRVGSGRFFALRGRYVSPQEGLIDRSYLFPVREVRPVITATGALGKSEDIHRFFDYGGNSIVAVADQIFTVENKRPLAYLSDNAIPRPPRANLLVTYDRFTGKTLWGWQDQMCSQEVYATPSVREEWSKDYQAHKRPFFRGPGVASGTMLYTIAYEAEGMDGVSLWAFDLKQGRIRFRTLIHHPDEVRQRLPVGASLAVAGGVVYVVTSSGVLAAVDALPPGRVRWISRYTRTYEQSGQARAIRGRGRRSRSAPWIKVNFAYNDPVVSAGKVILAAPDSQDLIAFDAETGHIAWRLSRQLIGKHTSYIVGVSQGVLVMGGNEVCGIDVAKGEVIWGPTPLLSAVAYGRGFVGTKYAYIPTTRLDENRAAVYRYDIKTGAGAPPLRFDVRKLGNLLSIDGRLIAANDDEIMCFTTAQRELDALDQRMKRGGETGDALLERAHIRLKGGGSDAQAREDYARARAAARTRKEPMRDLRLGSLEHLFRVARKNSDLTAIEEARTITKEADAEKDPLSRLTPYEAQAALLEAQILGDLGRAQDAFDALEKFLDNYADEEVVLDDEEVTDGAAAAKRIRTKLMKSNRVFQEAFVRTVRRRIREALEKGDIKTLEAIPERYDNAPPTEESLFALAGLHESNGETVEAEVVLRDLAERYKDRPAASEAHLRLARILIGKGLLVEARAERNRGVGLMHEQDRARLADLLAEIDRRLPAPGQPSVVPRLALPLKSTRMRMQNVTPVQIHGNVSRIRKDLLLVADARSYYALDRDGNLLWTQPNPAGADVPFGNDQDPDTNIVAAAVASARFAMAVRGDLIIGDVFGLTRIDATNGQVRWQRPAVAADAARDARAALAALRADITVLKKQDSLPRGNRLPRYTIAGGLVVSVDPIRGVETFGLNSGELIWQNPEIRSPTIGAPLVLGQLLAVGWAHPGRVRVFSLNDGNVYLDYKARADTKTNRLGVLLAPPILDPVGRLLVVTGKDTSVQPEGRLELVNARTGRPAFLRTFPAHGRYARVLFVDGTLVVYHDGGSGGENLHFIDLKTQRVKSTQAADLLREVEVINDRARLFVFTYTLGLADLGARLFRVDIEGQESLNYERPPGARAYARPLLTRNHIVIAASGAASARLRLYDREASRDSIAPKRLFLVGGGLLPEFEVRSVGEVHYSVPPAVALADRNLVFSTAFLNLRFVGPKPR